MIKARVPARPLLRVPPFPGARCTALVRDEAPGPRASEADFHQAKAALAKARVGGAYWGAQPALPRPPYTIVSIADPGARAAALARIGDARPVVGARELAQAECDPWHMLGGAAEVHADLDDDIAMLAGLSDIPVVGTDGEPIDPAVLDERLFHSLLNSGSYRNPFNGADIGVSEAIALSAHWRELIDANRPIAAAIGFAGWKRTTAAPLLWGGTDAVPFGARARSVPAGAIVAVWKSRTAASTLDQFGQRDAILFEVEDGFIRSIGLGADCVPPLSLVVDRRGIYFDPQRPSDLEHILQTADFSPELLDRARRLRALIVERGISKYGAGKERVARRNGRRHLLVPGQVEDDRSVQCGGGAVNGNAELLRRVRQAAPDAYILYKPHPDVEAGHRVGALDDRTAETLADEVVRGVPIDALIDMVDEVHVNTSLAGFEALLREKPVTTHGVPFYSGWGLTRDLGDVPDRRSARRTLDELVAATLLLYPRYLDPVSGLPCTAEVLVERLAEGATSAGQGPLVPLRRLQGRLKRRLGILGSAR